MAWWRVAKVLLVASLALPHLLAQEEQDEAAAATDAEDLEEDDEPDEYSKHIENLIRDSSFAAPFNSHDEEGNRYVPYWFSSGDALTKQSFVRLTPDVPQTRGWIWSRKAMDTDEFSFEWKFRISGMQEHGSGESLGLWLTTEPRPKEGPVFGMAESFVGLAVVVDTKRNEGDTRHRDISVIVNDGTKLTRDAIMTGLVGCNASVRYWEGRDDFNVLRASRLRAKYADRTFTLDVDSRNTGRWRRCVTLTSVDLPAGWGRRATVGLLAENREESNNNDVLSLRVFKSPESAWVMEHYEGEDDDPDGEWAILVHHIEHEMFTVHSSLKSAVQLLEKAETTAETRITALEDRLSGDIARKLEERMRALEGQVHRSVTRSVHSKVTAAERTMADRMESTLSGTAAQASRSWRTPFYLLSGAVGAMCLLSYFKYRELRKEHLL